MTEIEDTFATRIPAGLLDAYPILAAARIGGDPNARGFSGALVLRVTTAEATYCLRKWPSAGLPTLRLHGLHRFLSYLKTQGVAQIPNPVPSTSGATLVEIAGDCWQLEPWLPGVADFHQSPTRLRLQSAMQTLARVHLLSAQYDCCDDDRNWFARQTAASSPAVAERMALIDSWDETRCVRAGLSITHEPNSEFRDVMRDILLMYPRLAPTIRLELETLATIAVPIHPCLRDLWHDHLLFTNDELTGMIDPAATRSESVTSDLSRLLGSLLGDDRREWEFALNEYEAIRPLRTNEQRLLVALDRSSVLLSGLTWIDRRINGRLCDDDIPRVMPRLKVIHHRLQLLVRDMP